MACKYCDSVEYERGMCAGCLVVHLKAEIAQLRQALRPFAHPDLSMVTSGNVEGDSSPVFQRNKAVLRIGDFKKAMTLDLSPLCVCPEEATDEACEVCLAGDEVAGDGEVMTTAEREANKRFAAACQRCGGWTACGGMSQYADTPNGCTCNR